MSKGLANHAYYRKAQRGPGSNNNGYLAASPVPKPTAGSGGDGSAGVAEQNKQTRSQVNGVLEEGTKKPKEESKSGKTRELEAQSESPKDTKKDESDKPSNLDKELQKLLKAKLEGKALPVLKCSDGTFVNIIVKLSDVSEEILKKLKDAGFELKSKGTAKVTGRIKIESLKKLCELTAVEWVKPAQD